MLKQKFKKWNKLKVLFFIPVVTSAIYAFSSTEIIQDNRGIENLEITQKTTNQNSNGIVYEAQKLNNDSLIFNHVPILDKHVTKIREYGASIDPLYRTKQMHLGKDFIAPEGTEIYAVKDGTVIESITSRTGYGNIVKIDHGNNEETWYAHNQKNLVKKGEKVEMGQVIALVGNTGRSTGPHLHFEVRKNGKSINPSEIKYMSTESK